MAATPDIVASSIVLAATYSLVALGWVLVFRASKTFNFATGEFLLLGVYLAFWLLIDQALPFPIGIAGAMLLVSAIGILSYFGFLRPLSGRPLFTAVILTLGLAIALQSLIRLVFGPATRVFLPPFDNVPIQLPGDAVVTTMGVIMVIAATVIVGGLMLFFRWTKVGVQMRAAAEQPLLASQTGIRVNGIFATGWGLAVVVASVAGLGHAYQTALTPGLAEIGLRGIAPAIVGGFDSVGGAAAGALIVAFAENFLVVVLGPEMRTAAAWLVLLIVLLVRPHGLFGTPAVRRV